MSYPVDRLAENSVVRNFRITAIHALEAHEDKPDPKGGYATVNQKLTVQKQAKKESRNKGGEA
jgi:predicted transcriptional regulator